MKLVRLRYFVAVAEELNFTRAAAKLRVAQPALSRQIRTLEHELEAQLLVRDGRAVKLTPAGQVLFEEGAAILAHYAVATQRAREAANGNPPLRVGIGFGLGEHVDRVVTRHAGSFTDVYVQPEIIASTAQNLALKRCEIDIGFLRPPVDAGYLRSHFLFEERLSALVPAVSPFTKYKAVRLSQLANIPLLLHPRSFSSGLHDRILDLYRVRGITPTVHTSHSGPGEEAGHMLVASRKGIYIVYASLAIFPVFSKRVKVLPGRPGEFRPEPPTDPDVNLSIHPARATLKKAAAFRRDKEFLRFAVDSILTGVTCLLRSTGITPLLRYYEAVRPRPVHRYFRPHGSSTCAFSLPITRLVLKFHTKARMRVTPPMHRNPAWTVSR